MSKSKEEFFVTRFDVIEPIDANIEAAGGIIDYFTPFSTVEKKSFERISVVLSIKEGFDIEKFVKDSYGVQAVFPRCHTYYYFDYNGFSVELTAKLPEFYPFYCDFIARRENNI